MKSIKQYKRELRGVVVGAALVAIAFSGAGVVSGALAQPATPPINHKFKVLTPEGNHLYLVFSSPAASKEAEYNRFYERHVGDIMKLPGFVRAQRFVLSPRGRNDPPFKYLTVYELKGKEPGPVIGQIGPASREGRLEAPDKALVPEVTSSVWTAVGQRGPH
jgi:hypothetical protein